MIMACVRVSCRFIRRSNLLSSLSAVYPSYSTLSSVYFRDLTSIFNRTPQNLKCFSSIPLLATCASDKIPDVPELPTLEDVPVLNVLGEPTFASLGLNSYWPSGWYQALLEFLHVNLDIPWWAAIATSMNFNSKAYIVFYHTFLF